MGRAGRGMALPGVRAEPDRGRLLGDRADQLRAGAVRAGAVGHLLGGRRPAHWSVPGRHAAAGSLAGGRHRLPPAVRADGRADPRGAGGLVPLGVGAAGLGGQRRFTVHGSRIR